MVVEKPLDVRGMDKTDENILKYTQQWTSILERYVRKYPEQWVWLHSRWKTQPREYGVTVN
jgi:KDO2-lipid IV(A) lauroyltransferase